MITRTGVESWSSVATCSVVYADDAPRIASADYPADAPAGGAGQPGTFTFTAYQQGSTEFVYSFDYWQTTQVVAAGHDRTATITWTPSTTGFHILSVYSQQADGVRSRDGYHNFIIGG